MSFGKKCLQSGKYSIVNLSNRLEPITLHELRKYGFYECPLYKTSKRAGELSTTGHSTNFIMYFYLKTEEENDHWIRRGTALILQLDS